MNAFDSTVFVVEVRHERTGARALVRAAESTAVSTFTSANALWDFLLRARPDSSEATPEQRSDS